MSRGGDDITGTLGFIIVLVLLNAISYALDTGWVFY